MIDLMNKPTGLRIGSYKDVILVKGKASGSAHSFLGQMQTTQLNSFIEIFLRKAVLYTGGHGCQTVRRHVI